MNSRSRSAAGATAAAHDRRGAVAALGVDALLETIRGTIEAQFYGVLNSLPDAVVLADAAGRIVLANNQAGRLFGYAADELEGQLVEVLVPERFRATHVRHRAAYAADPRPRSMGVGLDLYGRRKDGSEFPVEISLSPLQTERGTLAMSAIRDVSERRRAEDERAQLTREQAARTAAEATVRQLHAIQAVTDVALAHLAVDDLLPELLGRLQTLLGVDTVAVLLLDESGQVLATRAAVGLGEDVASDVRVPLGSGFAGRIAAERRPLAIEDVKPADLRSTLLRAGGVASLLGVPLLLEEHVLGVLHVGTLAPRRFAEADLELLQVVADRIALALDRARLYEQERVAHEAAEAAVRERDEFLSVAAHELKTPITSLRGAAQVALRRLARRGALDPEQVGRTLQLVDRQAGRLNHLVVHLLDVARIEAGKLTLAPEPADLRQLVADVLPLVSRDPTRHQLVVHAPTAPVLAVVDPLRLEQVLLNLLTNAVKYSPDGGTIEVDLARPAESTVRLAVRDHGVGIPPERRAHLFERFYQAHGEGHLSGLGLGLYVSREIVQLHGGTITSEFPPDGGTRFVVTLPTGLAATREARARAPAGAPVATPSAARASEHLPAAAASPAVAAAEGALTVGVPPTAFAASVARRSGPGELSAQGT